MYPYCKIPSLKDFGFTSSIVLFILCVVHVLGTFSLFILLTVHFTICLSLCLSFSVFLSLSLYLHLHLSISICLCLSISVSLCLSVFVSLSLSPSVYLSLSLYLCLSLSLSLYLSVSLSLSLCLFLSLFYLATPKNVSGVLWYAESQENISNVLNDPPHSPYIVILEPDLFTS